MTGRSNLRHKEEQTIELYLNLEVKVWVVVLL